jgi:ligand-binding sensor domain-containing protein/signal transduction histidine kinase
LLLAGIALAVCPRVFALDPALDVSQYAHTSWKIREGFTKGTISAIAQTPDGYLWLGTEFGLLRFDGVRAVTFQPPADQRLPASQIAGLLVARDGTLWIGTAKGLASWKGGNLTCYPELAGQVVFRLLEDSDGTMWAGSIGLPTGRLCAIQNGSVRCYGQDGTLGPGVVGLYEDGKGNLWVGVVDGLWRWKPGTSNFYSMPGNEDAIRAFAEADDGALLVNTRRGVQRFVDGKVERYSFPGAAQLNRDKPLQAQGFLRDRDGSLWVAGYGRGLLHIHQGKTDVFTLPDGLTGNGVSSLFEDREGNIWAATMNGLDRFRDFAVTTVSVKQGLSSDNVSSVLADKDGSVWLATHEGLDRWSHGQVKIVPTGSAKGGGSLNGDFPNSLFQDTRGRVWVTTLSGSGYLEKGRFISTNGVPARNVTSVGEDNAGNMWFANQHFGLVRLSQHGDVEQIPWAGLGHSDFAVTLLADPTRGGLWLGFFSGGIAYFKDGGIRASYTSGNGLGEGAVNGFQLDRDGTLWVATEGGLSRFSNGQFMTLSSKNGLPCDAVHWVIEDDDHSFWLYTSCGLVRITRSELDAWVGAGDKDKNTRQMIHPTIFDSSDGVRAMAVASGRSPKVGKATDGRLWFTSYEGFGVVDPRHLGLNKLPPPVRVEQIVADQKAHDPVPRLRLPQRIRDLEIQYTALSFVAPEKVLFRYKLEGLNRSWHDAGTRRQVFFANLPPGNYRFRVQACNNSGVWNEAGAALDFSVAPAYWQTWGFRLACVAVLLGLILAIYRWRVQQMEKVYAIRMDERVGERTRVARELHDTLLQSFQGVMLKFHAVTYSLQDRPETLKGLENIIEQAREAIAEGRDAVQGLRSSTVVTNNLASALTGLGDKLATAQDGRTPVDFRVEVEGETRDLHPIVRDEVYRIASEAVRNAFNHSGAGRIEVEICYDERQLRVRIRDNGKGIDPKVLEAGGRVGHHGLAGMRERAQLVGGKLAVWSELEAGAEVELTIPASVAYARSAGGRWPLFWRRGA